MRTCIYCRGDLKEKKVTLDKRWKEELFVIEDVPSLVCGQCGEMYFDGLVIEQIDQMLKERRTIFREIVVPVMKFQEKMV